jgi:hypothetical protein
MMAAVFPITGSPDHGDHPIHQFPPLAMVLGIA